jgi:hypothetical protein
MREGCNKYKYCGGSKSQQDDDGGHLLRVRDDNVLGTPMRHFRAILRGSIDFTTKEGGISMQRQLCHWLE